MMRRALILLCLAFVACGTVQAQDRTLAPGVTERIFAKDSGRIVVVEVDAGSAIIRVVSPQALDYVPEPVDEGFCDQLVSQLTDTVGQRSPDLDDIAVKCREQLQPRNQPEVTDGLFLIDLGDRHRPLAMLSGGYLQSFAPPRSLGYLKVAGDELNRPHKSWLVAGVFCTGGLQWTIEPFGDPAEMDGYPDCLQTGPFLVRDGEDRYRDLERISASERKLVQSNSEQVFICLTAESHALLGYTTKMTGNELSSFAVEQLGCVDALRLSGHVTAGLWLDGKIYGNSEIPLTNAIAVFPPE
jgi:hypothetical protein